MIVSHKLKVIYIKLTKVGGSSFEIALSKYCGKDDILSPLDKESTTIRRSLGFTSHRNYQAFSSDEHLSAREIKYLVPADVWNNYLKVAIVRCPYDEAISRYFFNRSTLLEYSKFDFPTFVIHQNKIGKPGRRNFEILHIDGKIATDFVIRFEHLDEDIGKLERKIDCPDLLKTYKSIRAKGNYRPNVSSYEMYARYPKAKLVTDTIYYKNERKYEFLREYWPDYKAKLEAAIKNNVSMLRYLFLKILWSCIGRSIFLILQCWKRMYRNMYNILLKKIRVFLQPWL